MNANIRATNVLRRAKANGHLHSEVRDAITDAHHEGIRRGAASVMNRAAELGALSPDTTDARNEALWAAYHQTIKERP